MIPSMISTRQAFGEARSALARGPSPSAWRGLCEAIDRCSPARQEAELLPYLAGHLASWPDALCVAPQAWVDALLDGEWTPGLRLARRLDLRSLALGPADLERLDQHEALSGVRVLELSGNALGAQGAQVMSAWRRISRSLHTLQVSDCALGDEGVAQLAKAPWLAQLDELDLAQNWLGPSALDALARQQWLSVKRLDLSGALLDEGSLRCLGQAAPVLEELRAISARLPVAALVSLGQGFERLWRLELGAMLNDDAIERWAAQPQAPPRLRELRLGGNRFGARGACALAPSALLAHVEALELSFNPIEDRGLEALCAQPSLRLRRLWLDGCGLSARSGRALARGAWPGQLQVLSLKRNALGGAGLEALLLQGPSLLQLERLHLSSNHIGPRGAQALGQASLPSLVELNLAHNPLHDEGAAAIAGAPLWQSVQRVDLSRCELHALGASALAQAQAPALVELSLEGCPLGDAGLEALLGASWSQGLEALRLDACGIGAPGAQALAEAAHMERLRALSLRDNALGERSCRALARATHLARLESLDLSDNPIGDEGLEALVEAALWPRLRELRLVAGQITSRGACALALAKRPWAALEVLDLGGNRIGDEGGQALAQSDRLPALRQLELSANELGARGMAALLRAGGLGRLELLGLVSNPLSPAEARALVNELWLPSLRRVHLWWNSLGQEGKRIIQHTQRRANSRKAALTMTG